MPAVLFATCGWLLPLPLPLPSSAPATPAVRLPCASPPCSWVHADPLTGWLDRAGDVESLRPRGAVLAYVVAFGGGGARDLTQKCARRPPCLAMLV